MTFIGDTRSQNDYSYRQSIICERFFYGYCPQSNTTADVPRIRRQTNLVSIRLGREASTQNMSCLLAIFTQTKLRGM